MAKKSRTGFRRIIFYFSFLLLLFVIAESVLRLRGFGPADKVEVRETAVLPEGPFFIADEKLGFKNRPGDFTLTLNGKLRFEANHDENGFRYCVDRPDSLPEVWIFGCSFTYGWGVANELVYPCLLAQAFPKYRIRNFGVGAYGTEQSFIQYQEELEKGKSPDVVVLAYASFHDQRNTGESYWLKALASHAMLQDLSIPVASLTGDGKLFHDFTKLRYSPIPGSSWLAALNLLQEWRDKEDSETKNSNLVSRALLNQFQTISKHSDVLFILAGIDNNESTRNTLDWFAGKGGHMIDISVDLSKEGMSLAPVDPHPSARAHKIYAEKLGAKFGAAGIK